MKIFSSIFEALPSDIRVLCWTVVNHRCTILAYDNSVNVFIVADMIPSNEINDVKIDYLKSDCNYSTSMAFYRLCTFKEVGDNNA